MRKGARASRGEPLDRQVFLRQGFAFLHVEAPVVDRSFARVGPRVLHEEHETARLGGQVFFVARGRMVDHGARTESAIADLEGACEDVPDRRKVVAMTGMESAGLVAHEARVRLGRSLGPRMEDHLAMLSRKAQRLPGHVVDVTVLGAMVAGWLAHCLLLRS